MDPFLALEAKPFKDAAVLVVDKKMLMYASTSAAVGEGSYNVISHIP